MHRISTLVVLLFLVSLAVFTHAQQVPPNVTQWRGTNRDGVITGFVPPATWPEQMTQRWKIDIGFGYAMPLVVGNRLYVFSRQRDDEVMSALDADNGTVLWRTAYPAPFTMNSAASGHGPGPKSTPAFDNGRLFAIGMTGVVTAYDGASGRQLWQKPGSPVPTTYTTHAFSPLIDGSAVIFHTGGHDKGALTAFDVATGAVKWRWEGDGPGYGSPIVTTLGGVRQVVTHTQTKLIGVDPATGTLLWELPYVTQATTNSITPLVYGQSLIVGGNGRPVEAFSPVRRNNQWVVEKVWENTDVAMRMSNPVLLGDTFFSLSTRNAGQYFILDARSGKTLWTSEGRQATNASLSKAGDVIFSLESDGEFVVMRASGASVEPVRRYKVSAEETWTQPVISGNRLFVKDVTSLTSWRFE